MLSAVSTLLCVRHSSECIDVVWVRFSLVPYINFFVSISEASGVPAVLSPLFQTVWYWQKITVRFLFATDLSPLQQLSLSIWFFSLPESDLAISCHVSIKTRQTRKKTHPYPPLPTPPKKPQTNPKTNPQIKNPQRDNPSNPVELCELGFLQSGN